MSCSPEHHVENCGHFGFSGLYLSEHSGWCAHEKDLANSCDCNPLARAKRRTDYDKMLTLRRSFEHAIKEEFGMDITEFLSITRKGLA